MPQAFVAETAVVDVSEKPKREPRKARKNDPRLEVAARELKDRWLEQVNADDSFLQPSPKYDVTRTLAPRRDGASTMLLAR